MTVTAVALTSCCGASKSEAPWIVDRFDDIKVIRYEVPGFEQLPLEEKELITIRTTSSSPSSPKVTCST